MGNHKLRTDKECENCGYMVEIAYCSKCGQKNVETRQSFPKLVGHFAEDLTHYDSAFWKSLKHLLFRPGRLTRIYLEGRRQEYVPPVKLYIFISFITFLLLGLLPEPPVQEKLNEENNIELELTPGKENFEFGWGNNVYKNMAEVEKAYQNNEIDFIGYNFAKAVFDAKDTSVDPDYIEKTFIQTIPKAIFLYMPIFSFWIWLLHGKKRWYFFDHGIFTLHYFSFLLLSFTIINLLIWGASYLILDTTLIDIFSISLGFIFTMYIIFYFFRSHRHMYCESRLVSRLKSLILFFINMFCMIIVLLGLLYYAFMSVH